MVRVRGVTSEKTLVFTGADRTDTFKFTSDNFMLAKPKPRNQQDKLNTVAITGAEGYIGSLLTRILKTPHWFKYDIITGHDINDREVRNMICSYNNPTSIINLAGMSGIKDCEDHKIKARSVNAISCIKLAQLAKRSGVKTFIQASTSAVYGEASSFNMMENHSLNPRSTYGQTKLESEKILNLATSTFKVIILRKSNVYGYGCKPKSRTVIDSFLMNYFTKQPIDIQGDGFQSRNFVHINDISKLYADIALAKNPRSGTYNVGSNETLSINQIAELINYLGSSILGWVVPITYKKKVDSGVRSHEFNYDYRKVRMEYRFNPIYKLEDYIKERINMFLRHKTEGI